MTHLHRGFAVAGVLLGILPAGARAQQGTTISGHVTTGANTPLAAASVGITALSSGAFTDAQGAYSFTVPASRVTGQTVTLTARRIGYQPKTVTITLTGASITHDFVLSPSATELVGVVVTALGVTRERSTLGTAQQQLSSNELNNTKTLNIIDQIAGKVSGVQITSAGTQGGSSSIVIRGQNSITSSNQPLFVVDGVPISNQSRGGSPNGAWDFGSGVSDLNPEDVQTMSVLKGPNAAALYGSRAANGVIVITTKKGLATGGRGRIDVSTVYTMDRPSRLWDYQNQYGQGAGGEFMYVDGAGGGVHDDLDQSFGPKTDGRTHGCTFVAKTTTYDQSAPCLQFTSPDAASPWVSYPDNVKSFFNTGRTTSTTVAAAGGTDRVNARLSLGSDNTTGIIPNNFFQKTSGLLSGNLNVNDRLSTNATLQYIRNTARNRPGTGYNTGILEQFIWFGRNVDVKALKNYKQTGAANNGPADREYNWNYNFHNNPWWQQYEQPEYDARDRFIATASATYKLLDWLNTTLSSGSDIFRYNIDQRFAHGYLQNAQSDPSYQGGFAFTNDYRNDNNTQLLFTGTHTLGRRLQFNGTAGGNLRAEQSTSTVTSTNGLSVADIYNVSNAAITPTLSQFVSRRQVNSAFGSAAFTYDGWWTVEGTARNDWSSTLPAGANSYFYPSVNSSLVLSDAFPSLRDHGISYLKLRGSLAQVGNDAPPYDLRTTYTGSSQKFAGLPQFSLSNTIANPTLKPEITRSAEGGVEVGLFDGRVTLDASYYGKSTRDQIFDIAISPTSGFSFKTINAGRIDNKGVEALLTLVPLRSIDGLQWTSTFNYTKNRSKVVTLGPGVTNIRLGTTWSTETQARVGEPYGAIFGYSFLRDSATGQRIINGGVTSRGPLKVLGNVQPNWLGSFNNEFRYRSYSLNVLFDVRRGGQFFSVSNFWGDYAGITQASLRGREVDWNNPGVVAEGMARSSCGAGSGTITDQNSPYLGFFRCVGGKANTDTVTSEDYFQSIYPVVESSILTDNWVKLRELRLSIELPPSITKKLFSQSASISFIGRNLALWSNVPNIDPEFSYTTGNYLGAEFAALPNPRSFGVSIRVTP